MNKNLFNIIHDMYNRKIKPGGFTKHYLTLYSIVEGLEAKNTFEFGTGLTTVVIIDAISKYNGHHTSCDTSSRERFEQPPPDFNPNNWTFLHGDSRVVAPTAKGPFDFVLHDGSHEPHIVEEDLKFIIPKMKMNSILMIHDTDSINYKRNLFQAAVNAFGNLKYEHTTLPYGYGLTIFRVLDNKYNSVVSPKWTKTKDS